MDEEGTKHLLAGFSRVKASLINGEDSGYFVCVGGDDIDHLLACETTNSVKPLSTLARGARYSELVDGVIADDFQGAIADPKDKTHWKRQPMSIPEIADRIGKSSEWVRKCIAVFQAPPEIRDMLESEKIAVTVVEGAKSLANKHHNGSEAKQIAICRRAFAFARAEGKDYASKQHFEAIKGEFVPEKKLVAAPVDGESPTKGKNKADSSSNGTQEATEGESKGETAESAPEDTGGASEAENLFSQAESELLTDGSKKNEKLKKALATRFLDTDALEKLGITMSLTNEEADLLAEDVVAIVANAREVF